MKMDNCALIPGFVRLDGVTSPYAIYCLLRQGKVVYIGKSTNVYARLGKHWQNMRRKQKGLRPYKADDIACVDFDAVMVKFCSKDSLNQEEIMLIQRYQPQHNRQLKRPAFAVDIAKIPAILEILKRGPAHQPAPFKKRRLSVAA